MKDYLEDNGICISVKAAYGAQLETVGAAVTVMTAASSTAALPILFMANPAIIMQFIDVLQIIKYILYIQVDYP